MQNCGHQFPNPPSSIESGRHLIIPASFDNRQRCLDCVNNMGDSVLADNAIASTPRIKAAPSPSWSHAILNSRLATLPGRVALSNSTSAVFEYKERRFLSKQEMVQMIKSISVALSCVTGEKFSGASCLVPFYKSLLLNILLMGSKTCIDWRVAA